MESNEGRIDRSTASGRPHGPSLLQCTLGVDLSAPSIISFPDSGWKPLPHKGFGVEKRTCARAVLGRINWRHCFHVHLFLIHIPRSLKKYQSKEEEEINSGLITDQHTTSSWHFSAVHPHSASTTRRTMPCVDITRPNLSSIW